jgi:hypothetical protein
MRTRNILLFLILIIISINISSASYNIHGYVKYMDANGVYHNLSYANVDFTNSTGTWGYHTQTNANGYYAQYVPAGGVYYATVSKNGYVTKSFFTGFYAEDLNYIIYVEPETAPNYILPHYVKFTVQNLWGTTEYKNVNVVVYSNSTSVLTGTTGSAGGFGAMLSENQKYRITFINATQGINREWFDYPTDSSYKIIVFSTMLPEERQVDDILFGLNNDRINVSTGYVNVTYNDTSVTTSYAALKIYQGSLNGTLFYSSTSTADNGTYSILVPANNTNYTVQFTIDNSQLAEPMVITRIISFYDVNRYDLGFDDGWNYIAISVCIIVGIFALFSRVNAEIGAVVGVFVGWFLLMIGWLNNGIDTDARLTMGLMMMLATLISVGAYIRKGEDI